MRGLARWRRSAAGVPLLLLPPLRLPLPLPLRRPLRQLRAWAWACACALLLLAVAAAAAPPPAPSSASHAAVRDASALQLLRAGLTAGLALDDGGALPPEVEKAFASWQGGQPCAGAPHAWQGVVCTRGSRGVTEVRLPRLGLSGSLPEAVGQLLSLEVLDLSGNRGIQGTLPQQLGALRRLTDLDLRGGGLQGAVPSALCGAARLARLSLAGNALTGAMPECLTALPLEVLDLASNQLTGVLPANLPKLAPTLRELLLSDNKLGAPEGGEADDGATELLPAPPLWQLGRLERLRLDGYAGLFGSPAHGMPRRLNRLGRLRELSLQRCGIGGTLEVSTLRRAKGLEVLLLGGNAIGGSVPPGVGALRALRTLGLEGNALEGSLPSSLADISGLQQLRVQGNAGLCGVVPKDVMKRLGVANRVDTTGTGLGEPCVSDSKEEL